MKKIEKQTWEQTDKKGMQLSGFVIVQNELKTRIARDTSPQAAFLYITILAHKNSKTHETFPSIDVLARELGVSNRTISNLVKELNDAGYIKVNSGKQKIANNYYFPFEDDYEEQTYDNFGHTYKRKTRFRKKLKENTEFINLKDLPPLDDDDDQDDELPF